MDRFKLEVKVFGALFHKSALSRFSRTLATLIRSGVPILQGLEIVAETVNNQVISRAVGDVQDSVAAKSIYTDTQSSATAESTGLATVEPSLTYRAKGTASTGQNHVSADGTTSSNIWSAAALSASGTCFWIKDDVSSGTTYGTGATCAGAAPRAAANPKW